MTYHEFKATIIAYGGDPRLFFYNDFPDKEEEGGWPYWPSVYLPEEWMENFWYYLWAGGKVYRFSFKTNSRSETSITREGVEELSKIAATIVMADTLVRGKDYDL